jgi:hypothetical protein
MYTGLTETLLKILSGLLKIKKVDNKRGRKENRSYKTTRKQITELQKQVLACQ